MGTEYTISKKHRIGVYETSSRFTLYHDYEEDIGAGDEIAKGVTAEEAVEMAKNLIYISSFNMSPEDWKKKREEIIKYISYDIV
jgi:hypothetical protein